MIPAARSSRLTCLRGELPEYAAGRLSPGRRAQWDHHLVSCAMCRAAVMEEQRLRAALAGGPPPPGSLRGALLAMATVPVPAPPTAPFEAVVPLVTLAPTAPPVHRSVLRSALLAAAAAGASAAAAWSLSLAGAPGTVTTVRSTAFLPSPASSSGARAAGGTSALPASIVRPVAPAVESSATLRAESTP